MTTKKVRVESKVLAALDEVGIKYRVRAGQAKLVDYDSLTINLTGKYAGFWTRWSRNVHGRNHVDLLNYLAQEDIISKEDAERVLGQSLEGKVLSVIPKKPYDFSTMVTDPRTYSIEKYLIETRKLNPKLVKRFIDLGLIVCDGRGNIRFLWKDVTGNTTGADVQGIKYDPIEFGKRGTLKLILPGSEGFFNVKSSDISSFDEIENIYLCEAPIDLISMIELGAVPNAVREDSPLNFPTLAPKSLFVAVSGSVTKVQVSLARLEKGYGIDMSKIKKIYVASDKDAAGDEMFDAVATIHPAKTERLLPNDGEKFFDGAVLQEIKDWNDLLKTWKSE